MMGCSSWVAMERQRSVSCCASSLSRWPESRQTKKITLRMLLSGSTTPLTRTFFSTAAQVRSCCWRLIAPVAPSVGGARSAARSAAVAAGLLRSAELVAESSTLPRLSTDWLARRLAVSKTPGAARVAVVAALPLARPPVAAARGGEAAEMTAGVSSISASSPSATCATSSEQQAIAAARRTSTCSSG